jgi:hypothetical protein
MIYNLFYPLDKLDIAKEDYKYLDRKNCKLVIFKVEKRKKITRRKFKPNQELYFMVIEDEYKQFKNQGELMDYLVTHTQKILVENEAHEENIDKNGHFKPLNGKKFTIKFMEVIQLNDELFYNRLLNYF